MSIHTLQGYASQALSCTEQMFALAQRQEWAALAQLEADRSMLLDSLFNHPGLSQMLAKLATTLRQIIELDQKTIALGTEAKDALKNEMRLLAQGKRAVDAYLADHH